MRKIELLAPAGDKESLIAAIQNGADAIYLGGTLFNARAYAKNFDLNELKWAVEYAHLHFVKIYVTVNILYKDDEFQELIQYLDYLYDIQVDALIVQDIGLFHVIKHRYEDFEIHMSTQASVMNSFAVQYFEEHGASRVVLARENTIEEIKDICSQTTMDIEVFVHGALCISYSGQCLMSSFIGKRSGNRGQCAQPCRLHYQLKRDQTLLDKHIPFLLSPKDLMTIEHVGDLIDAGVTSFKIEGRMKKPEYVASVVKAYRNAIDAHLESKKIDLSESIENMRAMFNRDYTLGYAFHDKNILVGDYSGNKGIIIGTVIQYFKKNKRVQILLNGTLSQGDSLVFEDIDKGRPVNKIYLQGKLVSQAHQKDTVEIEFDYPVFQGNVRKTLDSTIVHNLQKTYQKEYRRTPIDIKFMAKMNQKAVLTIICKQKELTIYSKCHVDQAIKTPLTKERICQQLKKVGENPFVINNIELEIDENISLPISVLNEMRRSLLEELSLYLKGQKIHDKEKRDIPELIYSSQNKDKEIHVLISTIDQLNVILKYNIDYIYYPFCSDVEKAFQICQTNHKKFVLYMARICKDEDILEMKNSRIYQNIEYVLVNDYGSYHAFYDKKRIIGTGFNIFNKYAMTYFQEPTLLSLEMNKKQISYLKHRQPIIQIYGKIENMISEYCPISQYYFGFQNKHCMMCKEASFSLIDRKNKEFDIMMDEKCRMHLLNCYTLFIPPQDIETNKYFIHFTNENIETTKEVIDDIIKSIDFNKKVR